MHAEYSQTGIVRGAGNLYTIDILRLTKLFQVNVPRLCSPFIPCRALHCDVCSYFKLAVSKFHKNRASP